MTSNFSLQDSNLHIDERNHVEKPLLDQLARLGREILDLDNLLDLICTFTLFGINDTRSDPRNHK
jgi:hypothetical protein